MYKFELFHNDRNPTSISIECINSTYIDRREIMKFVCEYDTLFTVKFINFVLTKFDLICLYACVLR